MTYTLTRTHGRIGTARHEYQYQIRVRNAHVDLLIQATRPTLAAARMVCEDELAALSKARWEDVAHAG